jgi:hypothetical protein
LPWRNVTVALWNYNIIYFLAEYFTTHCYDLEYNTVVGTSSIVHSFINVTVNVEMSVANASNI